jgi:dienelactone hydrolase
MITEIIDYECQGVGFTGQLNYSGDVPVRRPAVIVAHAWKGQDEFARQKAKELAELGYVGFAADVYGSGVLAKNEDEALNLMLPLFKNRTILQERIRAAVEVLQNHPRVDPAAIGAIGFCFGGLTVIELLRSGADVSGVVSFHGLLGVTLGEAKAVLAAPAEKIEGSILILHGHEDPLVSPEDIRNIQNEFTKGKVDWQMNIYGHAAHAFTNPEAHDLKTGMAFDTKANMRSWMAMCDFFDEIFP